MSDQLSQAFLDESLVQAANDLNADEIKSLLEQGANLAIAFVESARNCGLEGMKLLIAQDKYCAIDDDEVYSAIDRAIETGDLAMTNFLFDHYKVALESDGFKFHPLNTAISYEKNFMIKHLLERGCDVNSTLGDHHPLYIAARDNNKEAIDILMQAGADINLVSDYGSALIAAIKAENHDIFEYLIIKGADVTLNAGNYTALSQAACFGRVEMMMRLIEAGADVKAKSADGYSPLHEAAVQNRTEAIALLLDHGVDVNEVFMGDTTLILAARGSVPEVVALLLARGADIDYVNPSLGYTALDEAYASENDCVIAVMENFRLQRTVGETANHNSETANSPRRARL